MELQCPGIARAIRQLNLDAYLYGYGYTRRLSIVPEILILIELDEYKILLYGRGNM
jgi:hypothetical protein